MGKHPAKKSSKRPRYNNPITAISLRVGKVYKTYGSSLTPTFVAIILLELIRNILTFKSGIFSIIAVALLTTVVYTSLHFGLRKGLLSALIVVTYNFMSLIGMVESYSLSDPNFRRIVLLAVVLPALAFVVGRLKERNDLLLEKEKQARRKAEESEQRMRFMAEAMPQMIFTVKPDGTGDYFNPQWIEYTGLSRKEIKKGDWTKLIHPDDVQENIRLWNASIKSGEPFTYEHRLKRHDGMYRWHISRAIPMRDKAGQITHWVGSTTDIHDVKTALQREHQLELKAARLTEQRQQLIELNKAKDEFISLASHQLRTPATGVKQYLGMLLDGYAGELSQQQEAYLKRAFDSNDRQIDIINDLLKVAQVDAGKVTLNKKKVNLTQIVSDILDEQAAKFTSRSQQVHFEKRRAISVMADEGHLRMVLENIVDNASKYTPEGKEITVELTKEKDTVFITVKDQGVGIAEADIKKIFNKFSRIENPLSILVGGTGLGLYWAKKIIDLHKGSILVSSEQGKGSTFTIRLPA